MRPPRFRDGRRTHRHLPASLVLAAVRRDLPETKIMLGGMQIPSVRAILKEHVDVLADNFIDGVKQAELLTA